MLPEQFRLSKVRDFNLLTRRGFWLKGKNISAKVLNIAENRNYFPKKEDPEKFEKQLKIAFSVGLKYSKKAVERNRLKRQMREVVRNWLNENRIKNGYYILFTPSPAVKDLDFAEISQEMKILMEKNNLFSSK